MLNTYNYLEFEYQKFAEQAPGELKRHRIVISSAGPIGITNAGGRM